MNNRNKPPLTRQSDFFDFWKHTSHELNCIDLAIEEPSPLLSRHGIVYKEFYFRSLDNVRLHGNLLVWDDHKPRPLIVYTHGYNSQCLEVNWPWAEAGANVIGFDVRGFGESVFNTDFRSGFGYVLSGIEHPETSILRGAVCDYIQTVKVAKELLPIDEQKVTFYGYSFAGALSVMAAAITSLPSLLATGVPTLGWAQGRRTLVKRGSGHEINLYLNQFPEQEENILNTLSYFDPMNFADMINTRCLVGVGIDDPVVPPDTVYAIVNHMQCNPEVRVFPVSHSTAKEEALWKLFEDEWLKIAV